MNTSDIERLLENNPSLRNARSKLEAMQDGAYCQHRSWGFGQIKNYDAKSNRLLIDFPGRPAHPMAPDFCVAKLEIYPPDNILVRQKTEPKVIANLIKNDPAELVKQVLRTDPKQSMSVVELEGILSTLLEGPAKFKKWWSATKKLLVKDPDVAVPPKKDGQYALREDPLNPEQEILDEYRRNKSPLKKIELAEKLFESFLSELAKVTEGDEGESNARKVANIESDLHEIFDELTNAIKSAKRIAKPDPNDDEFTKVAKERAARLHGIWVRNDLCRHLEDDVDQLEPTSKSILIECDDAELSRLAAEIPQTPAYLKRLLDLITRVYPDPQKWQPTILNLLQKSTGKFTSECINFLVERESTALVAQNLVEWLGAQALRSPVLLWIVKNRDSKKYTEIVSPLINHRLLAAVLYAIDNEALQATSNRRIPLAEELSDDKELVSDLLKDENGKKVSEEIARDLAQSLLLNQGFEPLTKKSLLARFIKHYKSIENLVAGDSTEQSGELVVSQWSLDARRAELKDLIEDKIPENKRAIATAKEHGDLKENSEYKMARQEQETLLARKTSLERDLTMGRITDFSEAASDTVGIGSIVELLPGASAAPVRYTILGAWDSNPDENILSYKTPLAQKLLGKKPGDTVETEVSGNTERWTVRSIARWVDAKK
jgi:transcription elongation GreA/GreB family factor/translation initiation factor 2 beta subunit (eIF-2beta)/eIF-5